MSEYTTRQILDMIEANGGPEGLDLSGKDLSGIDLSRETIKAELAKKQEGEPEAEPVWVDSTGRIGTDEIRLDFGGGINLKRADLKGTDLGGVNLEGADLSGANLQGALLEAANLKEAILVDVNLQVAELEGARLQGAYPPGADFQEASLWGCRLQGVWLARSNLQAALLEAADFRGAELWGANLQWACLVDADLQGVNLRGANLSGINFLNTKSIEKIRLYRAILDRTQLTKDQLGGAIGEELRGQWFEAKEAYLALKTNFEQIGRYDDAAWAYRKERRMEKLEAWQKAQDARKEHNWREATGSYAKVSGDQLVELTCDYGESIWRVLGTMLAVWLIFALVYGLIAGVWGPWQETATGQIRYITRNPVDLLSFSLGAMTTLTPADLEARSMLAMRILIPLEAMLGIALAGLLGFVVGNQIRRS